MFEVSKTQKKDESGSPSHCNHNSCSKTLVVSVMFAITILLSS